MPAKIGTPAVFAVSELGVLIGMRGAVGRGPQSAGRTFSASFVESKLKALEIGFEQGSGQDI